MKQKKNAGKHQTGKAGTSRRRHLPRLSAISGLALTASLLSAGISEPARALEFTFEYTYTIVANTCRVSVLNGGTETGGEEIVTGEKKVAPDTNINWDTVTKAQLLSDDKSKITKTFGLKMDCGGDIYEPKLTVTPGTGSSSSVAKSGIFYVSENSKSVAGFAVQVEKDGGAKSAISLLPGSEVGLNENAASNTRYITLNAWPTLINKTGNLSPGDEIKGAVTIKVSYN